MGCFSSKISARSGSFKEELNRSIHRRVNGFPLLEDILISKNSSDQLVALVCTANTVAKKLRAGTQPTEPASDSAASTMEPIIVHETINAWELMADVEEQEKEEDERGTRKLEQLGETPTTNLFARSRSFHLMKESDMGTETERLLRSKSFHTLEEYDALVAGRDVTDTEARKLTHDGNISPEKGFRRKAMARQLSALSIPTTSATSIVFPLVENLGELGGAPTGEYITPRFGSFSGPVSGRGPSVGAVFDPNLLAELEEDMEELTAEEEFVLGQLVAGLGGGGGDEEDDGKTGN